VPLHHPLFLIEPFYLSSPSTYPSPLRRETYQVTLSFRLSKIGPFFSLFSRTGAIFPPFPPVSPPFPLRRQKAPYSVEFPDLKDACPLFFLDPSSEISPPSLPPSLPFNCCEVLSFLSFSPRSSKLHLKSQQELKATFLLRLRPSFTFPFPPPHGSPFHSLL